MTSMMKKNFINVLIDMQKSNNMANIWQIFLNLFNMGNIKDNSYLVVKTPFTHKKYYVNNNNIKIIDLNEYYFELKKMKVNKHGYRLNKKNKTISTYKNLSFSELEFSISLHSLDKSSVFKKPDNLNIIFTFFLNQLNVLLHINYLKMHSIKDDLTLLYNQNYLKSFIEREINRSKRYKLQFSVVFFDLDYLKNINENYGHIVGSEIIKEVSNVLKDSIRNIDIVARFGGDEFVIVFVGSNLDMALQICERLKQKIKEKSFLKNDGLNLKISGCFGIANFPKHGDSVNELIKKADMAMYEAKKDGKDGIKIYKGD